MANGKLGKKLDELLADGVSEQEELQIETIELSLIDPNPEQARKEFDEEKIDELAASIQTAGLLQPLLVFESGGRYTIVAGERRYRACKKLGMQTVPVIVHEANESEVLKKSLIENVQRENLNPIEEAEAISDLIEKSKMTQEQVAIALGKARPTITNLLRLLMLPTEVIEMVRRRELTAGHARCLVVIDDKADLIELAKQAIECSLSVHELETRVKLYFTRKKIPVGPRKTRPPQSREMKELLSDMKRIFATKVRAVGTEKKGRIYIDYYTPDDLQRIYELMQVLKQD